MRMIEAAIFAEEGLGLRLSKGWSMSIYSKYRIVDGKSRPLPPDSAQLVGATVIAADVDEVSVTIALDNGLRVVVGLRDEDFRGPEAAVVRGPSGEFVVIN